MAVSHDLVCTSLLQGDSVEQWSPEDGELGMGATF